MYCKNCGKFVGDDKELCDACAQQPEQVVEPVTQTTAQPVGLKKPITACVLATVAEILPLIGLALLESALISYNIASVVFGMIFILGSIAPAIVGLVFGIKCIKYFKLSESEMPKGQRIASLIMGIAATVVSAIAILCAFIYFVTFIGVLAYYVR